MEQLCINLCEETLQHFYNTHVFKSTEESCIEEGIQSDMDICYFENAPIVELISSQVGSGNSFYVVVTNHSYSLYDASTWHV